MNKRRILRGAAVLAAAGFLFPFVGLQGARADQVGDLLASVNTKLAPSVVSIRSISELTEQTGGRSRQHDMTSTLKGVVVSDDGLIMCSSAYFSSDRIKSSLGVSDDTTSVSISLEPKEIRVTVGDESTEYYASLAATDSSLGLAFLQIRDLKDRKLPFIDFSSASPATPNIGDSTASVTRLGKENDYAALAVEDRISGIITTPRKGYVPGGYASSLGLPVYGSDGNVIGVVTLLDTNETSSQARQEQFMSSLFDDQVSNSHSQYILPVSVVVPVIAQAKTRAAALSAFIKPAPRPATPAPAPKAAAPSGGAAKPATPAMPTTPAEPVQ